MVRRPHRTSGFRETAEGKSVDFILNRSTRAIVRLALCLGLLVFAEACAVRRVAPIRYIPGLGIKGDSSMDAILARALYDKNPVVRLDAVRLLGQMNATPDEQRKSAAALGKALDDKDENLRLEAVRSLSNFQSDIAGPYLMKAMQDESIRIRLQVVVVLRRAYESASVQTQAVTNQ